MHELFNGKFRFVFLQYHKLYPLYSSQIIILRFTKWHPLCICSPSEYGMVAERLQNCCFILTSMLIFPLLTPCIIGL